MKSQNFLTCFQRLTQNGLIPAEAMPSKHLVGLNDLPWADHRSVFHLQLPLQYGVKLEVRATGLDLHSTCWPADQFLV